MVQIDANEVVVSYWAIGPSFRNALKKNIAKYLTAFPVPFKFTILTDHVEDFDEIKQKTNRCLAVLDINEQRKEYDWSFELELIPTAKTDREYTQQFRENLANNKRFSYSLHRFVIPWMIKNGVTNFMMADPDVHIGTKNPDITNIQKYIDAFFTKDTLRRKDEFTEETNYVIGSAYCESDSQVSIDLFNTLKKQNGIEKEVPIKFAMNDGPFRFYRFKSIQDLQQFFDVWNTGVQTSLTGSEFVTAHGAVFLNDEILLGVTYSLLDIKVCPADHTAILIRHRIENRYMMPTEGYYKLTDTFEEFLSINREELIAHYTTRNWPEVIEELYGDLVT